MMPAPKPDEAVTFEYELDASPEKVWRALTVPELLAQWLPGGSPAQDDAPNKGRFSAIETIESKPLEMVRYGLREAGAEAGLEGSTVTFELRPTANGGTWLRLVHVATDARPRIRAPAANGNVLMRAAA
ncbi:SRPBCC domain-containing protein [Mesorhizobium sp. WSM2239]|uniref:SRPBCC domain-containing protein n=2 Tax=unclassified Mesorhizobium TaxID=325217 RepID=A0AAU8D991_9HYPH